MKILVLFLQYDTKKYPGAYQKLEQYLARLNRINWIIFRIDNAKPFQGVRRVNEKNYALGGDNSCWEFSGWQLGFEQAKLLEPDYDGILFVNDSFEVSAPSLLAKVPHWYIWLCMRLGIPVGNVDSLAQEERIQNIPVEKWVRTNCFIINRKTMQCIKNIVFVDEAALNLFIDSNFQGRYFLPEAPLSLGLQNRIIVWLTQEWHSAFYPQNNWDLFRNKTRAMLNEYILGHQLKKYSLLRLDQRLLFQQNIFLFICKICLIKIKNTLRPVRDLWMKR